ncbi:MAG: glycosyltransferase [Planctomycetia bacterium]
MAADRTSHQAGRPEEHATPRGTELVLTTYNNPRSLALCLESDGRQVDACDSNCDADDRSGPETKAVVESFVAARPDLRVRHLWHEDRGFQKCSILNKAIASSQADFIVFIDGDVLIHPLFVARHLELARRGRWSTGSLIRLDAPAPAAVTRELVADGIVFDRAWLREQRAFDRFSTWLKSAPCPKWLSNLLELCWPTRRSLCGANWSAWRDDILRVNGFDETITYGGLDKELGDRLRNAGIPGRHLRFSAPLVHLDHSRPYADTRKKKRNKDWIHEVRRSGVSWTKHGIVKAEGHPG